MDDLDKMFYEEYNQEHYFLLADDSPRGVDNPGLNQDSDSNSKDDADFEESDDFHKYDDVNKANVDIDDEISRSNDALNEHRLNGRPTFIRTYDKNASDTNYGIAK